MAETGAEKMNKPHRLDAEIKRIRQLRVAYKAAHKLREVKAVERVLAIFRGME